MATTLKNSYISVDSMQIDLHLPSPLLSPYIKSYLILETSEERVNSVFPDTSMVMVFRYRGKISAVTNTSSKELPSLVVSGLQKSGRRLHYANDTGNILVLFREAGACAFIREPLHEFCEESIAMGDLSQYHDLSLIEEQLAEARTSLQRIAVIERFLLSHLSHPPSDLLIATALEMMHLNKGILRIKSLADELYTSQDVFEKRWRRRVGISPKKFSYILRMRGVLNRGLPKQAVYDQEQTLSDGGQTLSDIAYEAGYFDQAHFNKDFRLFTGQTPTDFIKSPVYW